MMQAPGSGSTTISPSEEATSLMQQNVETGPFVIEVNNLVKKYPGVPKPALGGISFCVKAGEIFGLLGPNGAGKTTTIRILTTQTYLTSGTVFVAGYDAYRNAATVKKNIAVVAQRPNLDKDLTPRDNLLFHAAYFGVPRAIRERLADELLEQLDLSAWSKRKVQQLSGGMAQRLMIARALMTRPTILFLDEPTTGLDPQSRLFLWDRIAEANARGVTIILTTHNMEEADRLCHRVGVIDHGQLIALDTPDVLKQKMNSGFRLEIQVMSCDQARLLEFTDALRRISDVEQAEIIDAENVSQKDRNSIRLYTVSPDINEEILRTAARSGLRVRELSMKQASLEDLFIHLTGKDLRS
jgi:ABC-2 type transport system ATP-binding protein